jgi:hypothetical protein
MTTVRNHGYSWKGFFVDNGMFPRNASETTSTGLSMYRYDHDSLKYAVKLTGLHSHGVNVGEGRLQASGATVG